MITSEKPISYYRILFVSAYSAIISMIVCGVIMGIHLMFLDPPTGVGSFLTAIGAGLAFVFMFGFIPVFLVAVPTYSFFAYIGRWTGLVAILLATIPGALIFVLGGRDGLTFALFYDGPFSSVFCTFPSSTACQCYG